MKGISEEVIESTFVSGLLLEIWVEIHFLQPCGLGHLMEMAQQVEDRNLILWAAHEPRDPKNTKILSFANRGDWKTRETFQTRAMTISDVRF